MLNHNTNSTIDTFFFDSSIVYSSYSSAGCCCCCRVFDWFYLNRLCGLEFIFFFLFQFFLPRLFHFFRKKKFCTLFFLPSDSCCCQIEHIDMLFRLESIFVNNSISYLSSQLCKAHFLNPFNLHVIPINKNERARERTNERTLGSRIDLFVFIFN